MGVSQSKILEHITKLTTEVKELDIKRFLKCLRLCMSLVGNLY